MADQVRRITVAHHVAAGMTIGPGVVFANVMRINSSTGTLVLSLVRMHMPSSQVRSRCLLLSITMPKRRLVWR
ncbi:hypothetical protein [Xanthomonas oryzae]|uniref:hypothetical protein n=1 Tax=Xanthomonas oryzae TaxID=347 RepID=UPI000C7E6D8E|nr:hypothetical protein [Xanthomonas oryzae]QBG87500.1 hypothetical protein EYC54_06735 [Xanthomonas oryzae]